MTEPLASSIAIKLEPWFSTQPHSEDNPFELDVSGLDERVELSERDVRALIACLETALKAQAIATEALKGDPTVDQERTP